MTRSARRAPTFIAMSNRRIILIASSLISTSAFLVTSGSAGADTYEPGLQYSTTSQFSSATAQAHFGAVRFSDVRTPVSFTATVTNGVAAAYVRLPALRTSRTVSNGVTWVASESEDLVLQRPGSMTGIVDLTFGYDQNGAPVYTVYNNWGARGCTVAVQPSVPAARLSCPLNARYVDAWHKPTVTVLNVPHNVVGLYDTPDSSIG